MRLVTLSLVDTSSQCWLSAVSSGSTILWYLSLRFIRSRAESRTTSTWLIKSLCSTCTCCNHINRRDIQYIKRQNYFFWVVPDRWISIKVHIQFTQFNNCLATSTTMASPLGLTHTVIFSDCDCDLFFLVMGYIGVSDVVTVAVWTLPLSPLQPIHCDKQNCSRNQKKRRTV